MPGATTPKRNNQDRTLTDSYVREQLVQLLQSEMNQSIFRRAKDICARTVINLPDSPPKLLPWYKAILRLLSNNYPQAQHRPFPLWTLNKVFDEFATYTASAEALRQYFTRTQLVVIDQTNPFDTKHDWQLNPKYQYCLDALIKAVFQASISHPPEISTDATDLPMHYLVCPFIIRPEPISLKDFELHGSTVPRYTRYVIEFTNLPKRYCQYRVKTQLYCGVLLLPLTLNSSALDTTQTIYFDLYRQTWDTDTLINALSRICNKKVASHFYFHLPPLAQWDHIEHSLITANSLNQHPALRSSLGECMHFLSVEPLIYEKALEDVLNNS